MQIFSTNIYVISNLAANHLKKKKQPSGETIEFNKASVKY